ncbi:hypothetical protein ACNKHV_10930 [Shigella flexneri]
MPSDSVANLATPASSPTIDLKGEPEWIFTFCLCTDVPLTAGLADSEIFHNTRDLTAIPVAHPAQFWAKITLFS